VVTNISSGYVEYCHVKTTPYLPVIDAIRMTLATPGETLISPNSVILSWTWWSTSRTTRYR